MRFDHLNELPPWNDDDDEEEEGEEWKPNYTREKCKALYTKWNEILTMINGAMGSVKDLANDTDDEGYWQSHKAMILGDAFEVGAKIRSSEAGGIYVLRMENAAIIRKNAQSIKSFILSLMYEGELEEEYGTIIRAAIDEFRELFKQWLATFVKDEYEDEWGLFV